MKQPITKFKDMTVALKELAKFVRDDARFLATGREIERFGRLRPREMLANWLICAAVNEDDKHGRMIFTTDPDGGDGIIWDQSIDQHSRTEHIYVRQSQEGDPVPVEQKIADAVGQKQGKGGAAYAKGKVLVIFLGGVEGPPEKSLWYPKKAAEQLPANDFVEVWVVGLHRYMEEHYLYFVCRLKVDEQGFVPRWGICISPSFDYWTVKRLDAGSSVWNSEAGA